MATRSVIGKVNADGTVTAIYCHWDGYVSNNGAILHTHYQDPAKVDALLALGGLSSLGPELGEPHDFSARYDADAPQAAWCVAYGRDRGDDMPAARLPDVESFQAWGAGRANGYGYLLTAEGWLVYHGGRLSDVMPLAEALAPATPDAA